MKKILVACCVVLMPGLIQAGEFPTADLVIIEKAARQLHLLHDGEIFRTFRIALGMRPVGDKKREGDFKTHSLSRAYFITSFGHRNPLVSLPLKLVLKCALLKLSGLSSPPSSPRWGGDFALHAIHEKKHGRA